MSACIKALDFMPGCGWPMWAQIVVTVILLALYFALTTALRRRRRRSDA